MPTEILEVDGINSSYDNWTLAAGSTKVVAVQTPDDDSTSYINSGTTISTLQRYTLASPVDIQSGDTINSVTVYFRHIRLSTPAGNIRALVYLGGAQTASTTITTGGSWTTSSEALARPGGGSWAYSDLANLEVAVQNGQTRDVGCTTLYVEIDYTASVAPVTVPLDTLSLVSSIPAASVVNVPPPRTVPVNTLTLASSIPAASVVPGAVSVLLDTLQLSGTAVGSTVLAPITGIDVPLNSLTLAGSMPAASVVPGAVSVALNTLNGGLTVPSLNVQGGAVQVLLNTLSLAGSLPSISVSLLSYVTVYLDTLTLSSSIPGLSVVPGGTSVALNTIELAGSVPALGVLPGAITVALNTIELAGSVVGLSVLAASTGQTVELDTLNISLTVVGLASPRGRARRKRRFMADYYYKR